MKKRLDVLLVERGLAPTRSQARLLIEAGAVEVDGRTARKPGQEVESGASLGVRASETFVGRGGGKLAAALDRFGLDPAGAVAADVGASTGGFTECLLRRGAARVYAIDVGHDQLAPSLRADARVLSMEGVNVRHGVSLPEPMDAAVADLSFISLRLVLGRILELVREGGWAVVLLKPQFEGGPEAVGKRGIVRDARTLRRIVRDFAHWSAGQRFPLQDILRSPVEGKEGNREFLTWYRIGAPSGRDWERLPDDFWTELCGGREV